MADEQGIGQTVTDFTWGALNRANEIIKGMMGDRMHGMMTAPSDMSAHANQASIARLNQVEGSESRARQARKQTRIDEYPTDEKRWLGKRGSDDTPVGPFAWGMLSAFESLGAPVKTAVDLASVGAAAKKVAPYAAVGAIGAAAGSAYEKRMEILEEEEARRRDLRMRIMAMLGRRGGGGEVYAE